MGVWKTTEASHGVSLLVYCYFYNYVTSANILFLLQFCHLLCFLIDYINIYKLYTWCEPLLLDDACYFDTYICTYVYIYIEI